MDPHTEADRPAQSSGNQIAQEADPVANVGEIQPESDEKALIEKPSEEDNSSEAISVTKKSDKGKEEKKKKMVSPLSMFRFATKLDYFLMLIGAVCAMANGAAIAGFSIIMGDITDALNSADVSRATDIAVLFVWIGIGTFVAATLQVGLWTAVSERMTIKLRQEYLDALLAQDISFFDGNDSGTLTSKIAENSLLFREALGEKFAAMFQLGAMFLGGLIVGFTFIWQLCLVIVAISPLLGLSGYFMAKSLAQIVSGQLDSYAAAGAIADETFSLIRTVTSFGQQKKRVADYDVELQKAAHQSTKQGISMGLGFGSLMFIYFCSYAIAFYVGSVLVRDAKIDAAEEHPNWSPPAEPYCVVGGEVPIACNTQQEITFFETEADVCGCAFCKCGCFATESVDDAVKFDSSCTSGGDVLLTFVAVLIGSFAVGQAAPSITAFTNGRVAAAALYEVIDRVPAINAQSDEGLKLTGPIKGDIKFTDVAFTYPSRPDAPVFTKLNMHIPGGKRVALVGESGSGKSTCIALLERYYDPSYGVVSLDGHDLKSLNVKNLRTMIGLVSQEPILFGTTIRENVRFGRPDATDAEVEQACKDANAHTFIQNFPDKYNTFVTSSLVSGGQKQRIAIARALLRNPPILLLDEATAALDNESERLVNEAIDRLLSESGSRTTIVIAHRLSSIRACEKIIVLEKGKVVEEGSHDELINTGGLYSSLNKLSEGGRLGDTKKTTRSESKDSKAAEVDEENPATTKSPGTTKAPVDPDVAPMELDEEEVEIEKDEELIADTPALNKITADAAIKSRRFFSCCRRKKTEVDPEKKRYPIRKAFKYAMPEKYYFIPAVFAAAVNGVTFPVFTLMFSNLIEAFFLVNNSELKKEASKWCGAFVGLAAANGLANLIQHMSFSFINGRMTRRVRADLFQHVLSFEIGFFDEKTNNVGALTSKLASDAALIRAAISDRLAVLTMNIATMIAGFIIAFIASWKVSLVVFALFPAIVFAGALQLMVMTGLANSDQKALEVAAHTLTESVSGIRTVTAFGMQQSIKNLYNEQLQGPLKLAMRKGMYGGLGFGFSQGVIFFCYALTFWYGSRLVADREITFREMNQSLFGILMTAMALGQNLAVAPDIGKGQSAVNSVFRLLSRQSKINPFDPSGKKPSTLLGDLSFEKIEFAYPTRPDVTVLKNFNLTVKRGQTVAFVGTSGSGKSTLVLLLERFYDPLSGTVKIDGVDVKDLNVEWLRSQIGIVSQEPALFKGTVMENIRSGRPDATDEEVIEAAKMANAHDFILRFADGYNTNLLVASGVSGGQKQRIAIARALIRNPKILLLDEATSALDEESQKVVQQALDKLLEHSTRTTIVVAHRLSTIRNADIIVVLQTGVVVEQGSFDELANKPDGAFASLLKAQERSH